MGLGVVADDIPLIAISLSCLWQMGPPELPLTGGCGCGSVRFEVTAPLVAANYCHCTRCQRRGGTAASANARPQRGSFRLLSGEENYEPGGRKAAGKSCSAKSADRRCSAAIPRTTIG